MFLKMYVQFRHSLEQFILVKRCCKIVVVSLVASRAVSYSPLRCEVKDRGSKLQNSPHGKQVAAFFCEGGIINQQRGCMKRREGREK